MTPSDLETRIRRAHTLLAGYSPAALAAADAALRHRDSAALDTLLLAVLERHLAPAPDRPPLASLGDDADLVAQVGLDSFALAEMGFLLEDLFETRFPDDELRCLRTLGDLRTAVRAKLTAL
jgi:3-hydroxyacyl-[acyl-carrier-protein] dehydratase